MIFHDICEFDTRKEEFHHFNQEALGLPGFDFLEDKIVFVNEDSWYQEPSNAKYEVRTYKIDSAIPDSIKEHLNTFVESRDSFFQVVKYVLAVANINKIKYFKSFAIRAILEIPEGVNVNDLPPEELDKLNRKPVIIMYGCPEIGDDAIVAEEPK
jgi:hypothetical protein